jgi:hypothetical protein
MKILLWTLTWMCFHACKTKFKIPNVYYADSYFNLHIQPFWWWSPSVAVVWAFTGLCVRCRMKMLSYWHEEEEEEIHLVWTILHVLLFNFSKSWTLIISDGWKWFFSCPSPMRDLFPPSPWNAPKLIGKKIN